MAGRRLDGYDARLRRATRHDLPALRDLLGGADRPARFDRRLLRSLAGDVYVAERAPGDLVGALALSFTRSFAAGVWRAQLDGLWVRGEQAAGVRQALLAFAAARAARRHCRELLVPGPVDEALGAALAQGGFTRGESWQRALPPGAGSGPAPGS
jgi:hypothetical protein